MANVEEISQRIQRRLEELAEEGDRLRLAIEALGADNPHNGRIAGVRRAVGPAVQTVTDHVRPRSGERARSTESGSVDTEPGALISLSKIASNAAGGQSAPAGPRERALDELRRELAAGLRNPYASRGLRSLVGG